MSSDSQPCEARASLVDAVLYAASAVFALRVLGTSSMLRNRTWADLAWPAYTAGTVAALALAARGGAQLFRARLALAAAVFVGAVVVPPLGPSCAARPLCGAVHLAGARRPLAEHRRALS